MPTTDTTTGSGDDAPRPKFDAVAYEDVLAVRVLRKALGIMLGVLGFVVAVGAYAAIDVRQQRIALDRQRDTLRVQQSQVSADVARMRATYQQMTDSIHNAMLVDRAAANAAIEASAAMTNSYMSAIATQLVQAGKNQGDVIAMRKSADSTLTRATAADIALRARTARQDTQFAAHTLALTSFCNQLGAHVDAALSIARTANARVMNSWGQDIHEERRTPIEDSHFWIRFDDIDDARRVVTDATLWYDAGRPDRLILNRSKLQIGDTVQFSHGGSTYRLFIQSSYREPTRLHLGHEDRVVVRLERLVSTTDSTVAGADATCAPPLVPNARTAAGAPTR